MATVEAVALSPTHTMGKPTASSIHLISGHGVEGDAHAGATVKHRSRTKQDPLPPNLRQVHLIGAELHDRLRGEGHDVAAGAMGENVTTRGIDLLGLPTGTRLTLGADAVVEVTGLRNPCGQLNGVSPGLQRAVLDKDAKGNVIRLAGIMGVVVADGVVRPGDEITITLPGGSAMPLQPV